jgi:hypothetical protein
MKYFISAIDEDSSDILAREIEADDFEQAVGITYELARRRFGGRHGRITSVTEVPDLGPALHRLEMIATGVLHGRAMMKRKDAA